MMRWIMLGLTILGFALAFAAKSAGLVAFGIVLGFVGLFGMVFSMAADRVSASARPESAMAAVEDLAAMRTRRPVAAVRSVPPPPVTKVSTAANADAPH
jgi:hypothetical protein